MRNKLGGDDLSVGSRYGIVGLLLRTAQVTALIFWISLLGCAEKGWAAGAVVLGVLAFGGMWQLWQGAAGLCGPASHSSYVLCTGMSPVGQRIGSALAPGTSTSWSSWWQPAQESAVTRRAMST